MRIARVDKMGPNRLPLCQPDPGHALPGRAVVQSMAIWVSTLNECKLGFGLKMSHAACEKNSYCDAGMQLTAPPMHVLNPDAKGAL
jgi:hypothetical protein